MADCNPSPLPRPSADQRRAAAAQFERAKQVLASGNHDYGLQLLFNCCEIDPLSFIYRQALRQAQKAKYKNNLRGQPLASLRALGARWRLMRALRCEDYGQALLQAEYVLMRNPWDVGAHLRMAEVFDALNASDQAVWTLEQVRSLQPKGVRINRPLARLYEKRGNFTLAIALWELVRQAMPSDVEAQRKAKDLSASATIAKGRYEQAVQGSAPTPLVMNQEAAGGPLAETAADHHALASAPTLAAVETAKERVPREVAALLARIEAQPTQPQAYRQLAAHYRRQGQFDQASALLTKAQAATGNDFEIGLELLDLTIEPLRRDLAVAEEKLRQKPNDAGLQQIRAGLSREVNARELDYYRRRSDRSPTDTPARFEMSVRLLRAGQTDEAIRLLQTLRTEPRHQGKALFYLGLCFKDRNSWRLAQRNFEEALPQLTGDPMLRKEALYQLAIGCADAGDWSKAVDHACEVANLDFGYKDIGTLLDTWQAKTAK